MKKILIATLILILGLSIASPVFAKGGGGGGGHSSGGSRASSVRSVSASKPTVSKPAIAKPSTPAKSTVSTKPSSTTKTTTASTAVKSSTGKTMSKKGAVVDDNYKPTFRGGYVAPAGSVVYYRESSIMDWLPFYLIMTSQSHREAVVQTPDGKQQTVKEEGVDTMYVINWIVSLLLIGGLIVLIVWFVNKKTKHV